MYDWSPQDLVTIPTNLYNETATRADVIPVMIVRAR